MGKFKLYDTAIPSELIVREREEAYQNLTPKQKFFQLLSLIKLSIALNADRPIKEPQRKGLVISKPK